MPSIFVEELGKSITFPDDMSRAEMESEINKYLDGLEEDKNKTAGGFARGARAFGEEAITGVRNFLSTAATPTSPMGLIGPENFDALTKLKNAVAPRGEATTVGEKIGEGVGGFAGVIASDAPYFAATAPLSIYGPGAGLAAATASREQGTFQEDLLAGNETKSGADMLRAIVASGVEGALFGPATKWAKGSPSRIGAGVREGIAGAGIMGTGAAIRGDNVPQAAAVGALLGGPLGYLTGGQKKALVEPTKKELLKKAGYAGKKAEEKLVADQLGIPGIKPSAFPQNLNLDDEATIEFVVREFNEGRLPYVERMSMKDIFEHGKKHGTLDEQRAMVLNNAKEYEKLYGKMKERGLASEQSSAMDVFRKTVDETQNVYNQLKAARQTGTREEVSALQSRYDNLRRESSALLAIDMGYGTEAATTVAARNMFRKNEPLSERVMRILEKRNQLDDEMMDRIMDAQSLDEYRAIVNAGWNPTWGDKFHEAWLMGMLSNPITFGPTGVNTISNIAKDVFLRIPVRATTAAIEGLADKSTKYLSKATGGKVAHKPSQYNVQDFVDELKVDVAESLPLLRQWFRDIKVDRPMAGTKLELDMGPAIGGKLGGLVRTPGRFLEATDQFFRSKAQAREALKIASEKMGRKATWEDRRNLSKKMVENPNDFREEAKRIWAAGDESVFTTSLRKQSQEGNAIANVSERLQSLKQSKNAAVRIAAKGTFPFVRTPANIAIDALKHSPIGILEVARLANNGATRREISEQLGKIAVGSTMMTYVVGEAAKGNVTGGGPSDYNDYQKWLEAGYQPYSMKLGDKWVSYQRIEPFASIFGAAADFVETMGAPDDEKFGRGMSAVKDNIANKTFLLGLENISKAWANPKRHGTSVAKSIATTFVPAGGLVGNIARGVDPVQRMTTGEDTIGSMGKAMQSRIPWLRDRGIPGVIDPLEARYSVTGHEIRDEYSTANSLSPFRIADTSAVNIVDKEIDRLGRMGKRVPNIQTRKRNIPGEQRPVAATPEEYSTFHKYNKEASDILERIMNTPSWSKMSPDAQSDIIMDVFGKFSKHSSEIVRRDMYQNRN